MHRYVHLPFRAEYFGPCSGDRVTVAKRAVAAEVDLHTGTVTSQPREQAPPERREATSSLEGLQETLFEGPHGHVTTLSDREGRSVQFNGTWEFFARDGAALVGIVSTAKLRYDCVALTLDGPSSLRLPGSSEAKVALEDAVGACVTIDTLHVFLHEAPAMAAISVAIPPTSFPDVVVKYGKILVLAEDKLLILDSGLLPFEQEHLAAPIEYHPLVGRGRGDAEPATVVAVFAGKILVDHPKLRRLTLARAPADPPVERGDSVLIDDVREELPGIYRVYAWRKQGAEQSMRPPPPILGFPAPRVSLVAESELAG